MYMTCIVCCFLSSHHQELNGVLEEVGQWWPGCDGIFQWLGDTEGGVIAHKPLASSLDIIRQQNQSVQVCKGEGGRERRERRGKGREEGNGGREGEEGREGKKGEEGEREDLTVSLALQDLVDGVEAHKEDFERSMKALEQLSEHKQLLESGPVDDYKTALDRRWKALGKEVQHV
jgi:hypothetical protein